MTVAQTPAIRHKSKPPALEALAACNWLTVAWGDDRRNPQPPSIAPPRAEQGGIATMITQPKIRGEAVRRALLAIVEARATAGLPWLPPHRTMAAALGISPGQVTRHLAVLMDAGAFSTRCHGMHTQIEELGA
jgi:hypothetical protein